MEALLRGAALLGGATEGAAKRRAPQGGAARGRLDEASPGGDAAWRRWGEWAPLGAQSGTVVGQRMGVGAI